jgi:hypothetical protein
VSEIKNKTAKILANQKITDNQNIFLDEFIETQMSQAEQCFHKLETYPITKFSRDYLERMQELDDLCFEKTKKHLIAYGENPSICLNLSLDKKDFFSTILYPE